MRHTVEQYEAAVERMRRFAAVSGGEAVVEERDYRIPHRPPYRYATLRVEVPRAQVALMAGRLAAISDAMEGYLVINTHEEVSAITVSVDRDLTSEEIAAAGFEQEGVAP